MLEYPITKQSPWLAWRAQSREEIAEDDARRKKDQADLNTEAIHEDRD